MHLEEVKDSKIWNHFVSRQTQGTILQSWSWKKLLEKENSPASAYFVKKDNEILAACLVVKKTLPFNRYYLYCPRGPIFKDNTNEKTKNKISTFIARWLKTNPDFNKAIFVRLDPGLSQKQIKLKRWKKAKEEIQPRQTIVIDLQKPEKKILKEMKANTRNSIKRSFKKGVSVKSAESEKDLEIFWNLLERTAKRDEFFTHNHDHYKNLWQTLPAENLTIYLAEYKNKVIAASMIARYGHEGLYLHAASDYKYRKLMAPYALQWHTIKELKNAGYRRYDLWGVAPKDASKNHPWYGFTRFKEGFGGQYKEYLGTHDYIYKPIWYLFFNLAKKLSAWRSWLLKKIKFQFPNIIHKIGSINKNPGF